MLDLEWTEAGTTIASVRLSPSEYVDHRQHLASRPMPGILCDEETPVSELQQWTAEINRYIQRFNGILTSLPPNSLNMKPFTVTLLEYTDYLKSLPGEICVGDSNATAAEEANRTRTRARDTIQAGITRFENTLSTFADQVVVYLNRLYSAAETIDSNAKNYQPVSQAVDTYNAFIERHEADIYEISETISQILARLDEPTRAAESALEQAFEQIQKNIEQAASGLNQKRIDAEGAFVHWWDVDGKQGYERFDAIWTKLRTVDVPSFNEFRVPRTPRIEAAVNLARQAVGQVETGFNSFPNFEKLPGSSGGFPHARYEDEDRKFSGPKTRAALLEVANAYKDRTGNPIAIGDLQYEHGGKMGRHLSHKEGIDADVDGVEVGNVPNHDPALALALA